MSYFYNKTFEVKQICVYDYTILYFLRGGVKRTYTRYIYIELFRSFQLGSLATKHYTEYELRTMLTN